MNPTVIRRNFPTKRILVTSDIHGKKELFNRLLQKMNYRPNEDALVIIGDLVQRGEDSFGVIHRCMQLAQNENVVILQGNNDAFALGDNYPRQLHWLQYYWETGGTFHGQAAKLLGAPQPSNADEMRELHALVERSFPAEHDFLRSLPHILETNKFLFAHAGLEHENLEENPMETVLQCACFHQLVQHHFEKLLLVGHYPTVNFATKKLSNAPLYHEQCNVLSIDGGNQVKRFGQLNGVILDNETGSRTWTSVHEFPELTAAHDQQERSSICITWPNTETEVLERGERESLCRTRGSDTPLLIPNDFLYENTDDKTYSDDITDIYLPIRKGERLALLWQSEKRALVLKENGDIGWLQK